MKKLFLLSLLVLFFAINSSAQIKLRLGGTAGLNLSGVTTGKGVTNFDKYKGYSVGLVAEVYKMHIPVALSAGVSLVERGLKYNDTKTCNKFIQVPIYAIYKQPLRKYLSIFGGLGPYASLRLNGNSYIKGLSDRNWQAKDFSFGANGKLGIELFNHFQLGTEYQKGFTSDYYKSDEFNATNSTWAFYLGILF